MEWKRLSVNITQEQWEELRRVAFFEKATIADKVRKYLREGLDSDTRGCRNGGSDTHAA